MHRNALKVHQQVQHDRPVCLVFCWVRKSVLQPNHRFHGGDDLSRVSSSLPAPTDQHGVHQRPRSKRFPYWFPLRIRTQTSACGGGTSLFVAACAWNELPRQLWNIQTSGVRLAALSGELAGRFPDLFLLVGTEQFSARNNILHTPTWIFYGTIFCTQ